VAAPRQLLPGTLEVHLGKEGALVGFA
jgi:hypothetical protein